MGGRRGRGPLNFFVTVVVGMCVCCVVVWSLKHLC